MKKTHLKLAHKRENMCLSNDPLHLGSDLENFISALFIFTNFQFHSFCMLSNSNLV
jgi:hypothetical protein